jgi:hypothetical protein
MMQAMGIATDCVYVCHSSTLEVWSCNVEGSAGSPVHATDEQITCCVFQGCERLQVCPTCCMSRS